MKPSELDAKLGDKKLSDIPAGKTLKDLIENPDATALQTQISQLQTKLTDKEKEVVKSIHDELQLGLANDSITKEEVLGKITQIINNSQPRTNQFPSQDAIAVKQETDNQPWYYFNWLSSSIIKQPNQIETDPDEWAKFFPDFTPLQIRQKLDQLGPNGTNQTEIGKLKNDLDLAVKARKDMQIERDNALRNLDLFNDQLNDIYQESVRGQRREKKLIGKLNQQKTQQENSSSEQHNYLWDILQNLASAGIGAKVGREVGRKKNEELVKDIENRLEDSTKQRDELIEEKDRLVEKNEKLKEENKELHASWGKEVKEMEAELDQLNSKLHQANSEIEQLKDDLEKEREKVKIIGMDRDGLKDELGSARWVKNELRKKLKRIKQDQQKQVQEAQEKNVCQSLIKWENISDDFEKSDSLETSLVDTKNYMINVIADTQNHLKVGDLTKITTDHKMPRGKGLKDLIEFYNNPPPGERKCEFSHFDYPVQENEQAIIQEFNNTLQLGLGSSPSLKQVINRIQELINKDPVEISTPFGEDLQVIKELEIDCLEQLFPNQLETSFLEQIKSAQNYKQLTQIRNEFLAKHLNGEVKQISVPIEVNKKNINIERCVWISLLASIAVGLVMAIKSLVNTKKSKRKVLEKVFKLVQQTRSRKF